MVSHQKKIQHLYLRAGFGESISGINKSLNKSTEEITKELFENSNQFSDLRLNSELISPKKNNNPISIGDLMKSEKKIMRKESRENIRELNIRWIEKMSSDNAQLREKMTLFWHGHFACRTQVAMFTQNQNNLLRKNALGKFGDLLMSVSKDPAMLQFLNNQQNRKSSPNENFAREVMELFTMGRGNYSETDIKEAARAFTGWGFNRDGEFVFRNNQHDFGDKSFMHKSGNFSGEDIINMILDNRKTSEHITEKIYKYFVNENPDAEIVKQLSKNFYESGYDISMLMKRIFTSDWFYDGKNIGTKIKSPVEFIVVLTRSFNIDFTNPKPLLMLQKVLGQMLFNPPNVAGWPGGKNWIDTSSLMYRLKLPEQIFRSSNLEIDYKEDQPEMGEEYTELSIQEKKQYKQLKTKTDLTDFINRFSKYDNDNLIDKLSDYLLQANLTKETKAIVNKYADPSSKENLIESLTLRLLSLPEYQLS
ncbi:MAG: DUF1800 domain-containing protein [Ignavibacteria bacterium]